MTVGHNLEFEVQGSWTLLSIIESPGDPKLICRTALKFQSCFVSLRKAHFLLRKCVSHQIFNYTLLMIEKYVWEKNFKMAAFWKNCDDKDVLYLCCCTQSSLGLQETFKMHLCDRETESLFLYNIAWFKFKFTYAHIAGG
jgi:hypothetical protein